MEPKEFSFCQCFPKLQKNGYKEGLLLLLAKFYSGSVLIDDAVLKLSSDCAQKDDTCEYINSTKQGVML